MTYYGETPYTDGAYTIVDFLETGQFVVPAGVSAVDLLVVGGAAGGGGGTRGAAGGAGGVRSATGISVAGTLDVVVGSGGVKGAWTTYAWENNHGTAGGESHVGITTSLVPTMTSNTTPSGTVSASSTHSYPLPAWRAFDGVPTDSVDDRWAPGNGGTDLPCSLAYAFSAAQTVRSYAVWSAAFTGDGGLTYAPTAWTFEGSNNGTDWTTLDTQSGHTDWLTQLGRQKIFVLASPASFTQYRVHVTANGGTATVIGYVQLFPTPTLIAHGGGYGSSGDDHAAGDGGCGGGKWATGSPGSGTSGEGYGGGSGYTSADYGAGGGGGAGGVGGNGSSTSGGDGGNGISSSISGTATYYGGGGAGDTYGESGGRAAGTAGLGGGGTGDNHNASQNTAGCAGTANTGGGGGSNGDGGSGRVIIRYLTPVGTGISIPLLNHLLLGD